MAAILDIETTVSWMAFIIVENQPYLTKAGKKLHNIDMFGYFY